MAVAIAANATTTSAQDITTVQFMFWVIQGWVYTFTPGVVNTATWADPLLR
jgi:hypothetical protein